MKASHPRLTLQGETPSETGIFHESETLSETLVGAQKPNKIRHILKSVSPVSGETPSGPNAAVSLPSCL